ncbi:MAG: nicotinate (nicotinamide) nucleotide adenylyltransferase [Alphaproteobacteria bacterium]|nr:nicotinate (nicotinamide) nucleotide adenylyltransferase [Alphaproteobacteria bacterium]
MPRLRHAAHLPPTSTRQRIGLFGGSFDPPHPGHMHVAETALKRLRLDEVWWFPTPGNPLKHRPGAYEARLAAVQVLTASNRAMQVSDIEARAKITYTIDLVKLLRAHCPHASFVWLMGSDSLENFHLWRDWQALAHLVPIGVIARPGSLVSARNSHFARMFAHARLPETASHTLAGHAAPAWTYIKAPLNRASSTALRKQRNP